MEGISIKLLNLSIQASILITVVLLLRFILNKSPKSIKCLLWALVAIRLVCPFSIESKFSLAPDAEVVSMDNYVGMPNVLSKTTGSDRYVKGYAIYRSTSENGKYRKIKTINKGTTTSYVDKGLVTGNTYYYKVRTFCTSGGKKIYSDYSDPASMQVLP